jgi:hypothetical protein
MKYKFHTVTKDAVFEVAPSKSSTVYHMIWYNNFNVWILKYMVLIGEVLSSLVFYLSRTTQHHHHIDATKMSMGRQHTIIKEILLAAHTIEF